MQKIEIKSANISDIDEILEIEKSCFTSPWSKNSLESAIQNSNSYFFKALFNGKIVGYGGMYTVLNEGYIYNIAVLKGSRGKGIGTALVKKLVNKSSDLNLEFLSLEVRVSNFSAIKLYEKCFFEKVGLRKNFYDNPKEDGLIMTNYNLR